MKITFILILLLLMGNSCNNKSKEKKEEENNYVISQSQEIDINESIDMLEINDTPKDTVFLPFEGEAIILRFIHENSKYQFTSWGPDPVQIVEGNYSREGSKVYLTPIIINTKYDFTFLQEDVLVKTKEMWELDYIDIKNDIRVTKALQGKGIIFYDVNSYPDKDELKIINGNEIIMFGGIRNEYRLTVNARVRNGPGTQYKKFIIQGKDFLPEDSKMLIYGYSRDTDTQNGLTGHWHYGQMLLYIDSEVINPDGGEDWDGWIFGPLLEKVE